MAGEEIRATLSGGEAQLGEIRAADIARLLIGLEAAVAAAAYRALGTTRRGSTGRHIAPVEAASRLKFRAVEQGSVAAVLALPDLTTPEPDMFDLDVDDLAGAAVDRLIGTSVGTDAQGLDPGIARALAELTDQLDIGGRFDALTITSARTTTQLHLDAAARHHLHVVASADAFRDDGAVIGSLREADFDRRTARLRTPLGESVSVSFPAELDGEIQAALRQQTSLVGEATYDPVTSTVRHVSIRAVATQDILPTSEGDFWNPISVADLVAEQGVPAASFDEPWFDATEHESRELAEALAELDG